MNINTGDRAARNTGQAAGMTGRLDRDAAHVTRVDWGFTTPERDRYSRGPIELGVYGEQEARRFVDAHPGCAVVRRTVVVGDWEEA